MYFKPEEAFLGTEARDVTGHLTPSDLARDPTDLSGFRTSKMDMVPFCSPQ